MQESANQEELEIIDNLWEWVEGSEPNEEVRGTVYIDEKQLREKVSEFIKKIEKALKKYE